MTSLFQKRIDDCYLEIRAGFKDDTALIKQIKAPLDWYDLDRDEIEERMMDVIRQQIKINIDLIGPDKEVLAYNDLG